MTDKKLLEVKNLKVSFSTPKGQIDAVRGVSFSLGQERLGIVGESGSGKSQTGRAILRLTANNSRITADCLNFNEMDLLSVSEAQLRKIRGGQIGMIMQDPKYSLNPVITVGKQIAESCRVHEGLSRREAKQKALAVLEMVHIREPGKVYNLYPHQVSGGMGQRVMIAMMLIMRPKVMIADEPTSALDVTVQMQVLALLDDMVQDHGMGLMLISHDLKLVASYCDRVVVMYGGQVMEVLDAKNLESAQHPYTQGLLSCQPRFGSNEATLPVLKRCASWLLEQEGAND